MTRAEQVALLRSRIEASGLSVGRFAREVLLREPRTVQRWLAMENPIPQLVIEWLAAPTRPPWPP